MRTQAALNPMHKSIRKPAAGSSRHPTAVKSNNVQELAIEIPPCDEGSLVWFCPACEKKHHAMPTLGHKMTHSSSTYVNHIRGCVLSVEIIVISHKWERVFLSPVLPQYHKSREEKTKKGNPWLWLELNKLCFNYFGQIFEFCNKMHSLT